MIDEREYKRNQIFLMPFFGLFAIVLMPEFVGAREITDDEIAAIASPYKAAQVSKVIIRGIEDGLASELRDGLYLEGTSNLFGGTSPPLYSRHLIGDVHRSRLFLARNGYPEAGILPSVQPEDRDGSVQVIFHIDPGPPVLVASVEVHGFPDESQNALAARLSLVTGQRFNDQAAELSTAQLLNELRDQGYAFSEVKVRAESTDSSTVAIRFLCNPGPRYRFGSVKIEGTEPNLEPLVRRSVTIGEGMTYSPGVVRRIEERLRLLDLFRQIKVTLIPRSGTNDILDLGIQLMDMDHRRIEGGIGYGTDHGFLGQIRWQHRNIFRRGRGIRLEGQLSTYQHAIRGAFWWPGLYGADVRQELQLGIQWDHEENYDLNTREVATTVSYQPSLRTNYRAGLGATYVTYTIDEGLDESTEEDGVSILGIGRIAFDGTRNRLDPSNGWILVLSAEGTIPQIRSDVRYAWIEGSLARYVEFGDMVMAAHVKSGWSKPLGETEELPPNVRFYAGGASSMRGFERRQLGPMDDSGDPLGGGFALLSGLEMRIPIWSIVGAAVFADAGQVWIDYSEARSDEMEYALGAGIRFSTPVGPVRIDVAHRLTDITPDQPSTVYHLALGHAF